MSKLLESILNARHITGAQRQAFLHPDYTKKHDPFLLPDMSRAVERLVEARRKQEPVTIYGDYDIDGLTATTILLDAFGSFGFEHVKAFIPNRFREGYGLTVDAVERIAATGTKLIVTVDCGSLSEVEIRRANELGVEVLVTDHHNVAKVQPPAVAVVNPKRLYATYASEYDRFLRLKPISAQQGKIYPFVDLAGCGVAFKLVQALQTALDGLPEGQEKWLLDLVAFGTVCDVVTLRDENRANVYWGLKVMQKTRRPGLKALMAVSRLEPTALSARSLGFAMGPRMNAAGRLETAQYSLDLLRSTTPAEALAKAQILDDFNLKRRNEQSRIYKEALVQAKKYEDDPVLVVSAPGWNQGVVGIVAAKLLEKFKKPTYVLSEMGAETKGSARSYGDFSAADAIRAADDIIFKGGGHKLAAGVSLPTKNIAAFRQRLNNFYRSKDLFDQAKLLLPKADVTASLCDVTETLLEELDQLEPFGHGNPQPILKTDNLLVLQQRRMGQDGQHVRLTLEDDDKTTMQMLAFNAPANFFVEPGERVTVWYQPNLNEWNGRTSVEGQLLHLEIA